MDTHAFLADPLLTIARDAAFVATARMAHWRAQMDEAVDRQASSAALVTAKGNPNDLVTVADSEIEALVTSLLLTRCPGDVVVGEEGAAGMSLAEVPGGEAIEAGLVGGPGESGEAGETSRDARGAGVPGSEADGDDLVGGDVPAAVEWHVDPIDGTVNFVRGIEHHCFSIGGKDASTGEWIVGLVAAPALRTVWFARRGRGAWRTDALPTPGVAQASGGPSAADPRPAPSEASPRFVRLAGTPAGRRGRVVATGFGYAPERRAVQLAALGAIMEEFDDIRRAGSAAIDLCMAAEGRVNAYYERGLGIYDWAAGALIAEEAGLHVLRPHRREDPFVAADTAERFDFLRARA